MRTLLSILSASLFVMLGGTNVWIMLTDRGSSKRHGPLWMRLHRMNGYLFISIFAITAYFMLMRLRGETEELPPRIVLHMSLALILAPLLIAKVMVARYQPPGAQGILPALGITIFSVSFLLVAINVAALVLRDVRTDHISIATTVAVVASVLAAAGTLLVRRHSLADASRMGDLTPIRRRV